MTRLVKRFNADEIHIQSVCTMIKIIGPDMLKGWKLSEPYHLQLLYWAAQLHEIGKSIHYSGYHKHSAYLVEHSHLAGFSKQEQNILAALLISHRRKLNVSRIDTLISVADHPIIQLSVILRLAVLMCRTRSRRPRPRVNARSNEDSIHLRFPQGYLKERPLTFADLEQERLILQDVGITLSFDH